MVQFHLNFGKTSAGMTGESKKLHDFGNELVRFAGETRENVRQLCKKASADPERQPAKRSLAIVDKTTEILNQFVILVEQRRDDAATADVLFRHLGVFLVLIGAQVDVCSAVVFAALDARFGRREKADRSAAGHLAECFRFLEETLPRLEGHVLEAAEWMFGIGRAIREPAGDVHASFERLAQRVSTIQVDAADCDDKVGDTLAKIRRSLITPDKRRKIIQIATVVGAVVGLLLSIVCTWYAGWGLALIGILIGTTGCGIVGAVVGFTIVHRRDTSLLEDVVKCSNQRDHLRKNFENFKFRMQNGECYLKYANSGHVVLDVWTADSEC